MIADLFQNGGKWDLSRIITAAMAIAYIVEGGYALYRGQHFDWQAFGVGAGSIIAGGGAGIWMHSNAAPKGP